MCCRCRHAGASARTARVLVLMVIPGQLVFMVAIYFLRQNGETHVTAAFVSIYLAAALMQVGEGESIYKCTLLALNIRKARKGMLKLGAL